MYLHMELVLSSIFNLFTFKLAKVQNNLYSIPSIVYVATQVVYQIVTGVVVLKY